MSKAKPVEQRRNSYEPEDLENLVGEVEEMRGEAQEILASARGKAGNIKKREQTLIKSREKELGIPQKIVRAALRQRELERLLQKNAESVGDDLVEMYVEASGQMSMFKPVEGQSVSTPGEAAAIAARAAIQKVTDEEQAAGAEALNELAGNTVN
jgi:hypothetical protein